MITIANANALHIPLPDQSVQCVVTSPPYWGLRDYGISDQIGLESTPAEYVAHIVAVMRECSRVLKDDGTLWLNLGDSYARQASDDSTKKTDSGMKTGRTGKSAMLFKQGNNKPPDGLKPKDLCGIPWRVAFALQDDGWYLRSEIIWHKPNPMPESVTDRPTKAHEQIFLLTKRARYYYDAEAIKETGSIESAKRLERGISNNHKNINGAPGQTPHSMNQPRPNTHNGNDEYEIGTRNCRSVWTIATQPYSGAHFATFPPALIEPMILAGTSARGECPHCGKAWVRVVETKKPPIDVFTETKKPQDGFVSVNVTGKGMGQKYQDWRNDNPNETVGWCPSCSCPPHEPIPQTVLDPFAGSGTTGQVAVKHGRRAVLLDLNTKYIDLQFERTNGVQVTMPL